MLPQALKDKPLLPNPKDSIQVSFSPSRNSLNDMCTL